MLQDLVPSLLTAGKLIGGLGLFLLAVRMITDGLRLAAGSALRDILSHATSTPARGIFTGIAITAVVQSSSAVTMATIGFVNAGLMSLYQALGIVYGANVGTTFTGWLVAAVGFKIKVEIFALPMIGIGMLLRLTGAASSRRGAIGEALTGFGLFFIGIDVLRETFTTFASADNIQGLHADSALNILLFLWLGFLMTVLTQSSSAAIALILTAATGGVLDLSGAAAMVIGANVGTTTTALLAAIGATSNARRVAAAHIIFNLLTALVALALLPLLLAFIDETSRLLRLQQVPAVTLALFHTVFNVLGVLLMWPLSARLAHFLSRRFRTHEEIEGSLRYLDRAVAETPTLALNAFNLELGRMGSIARHMAMNTLHPDLHMHKKISSDLAAVHSLTLGIGEFVDRVGRSTISADVSNQLALVLRIAAYYVDVAERAAEATQAGSPIQTLGDEKLTQGVTHYRTDYVEFIKMCNPLQEGFDLEKCESAHGVLETRYHALKNQFLEAGASGRIHIPLMSEWLEQLSRTRRISGQAIKAAHYLSQLGSEVAVRNPETKADAAYSKTRDKENTATDNTPASQP
jgi:phosphate:Na+ symporter